MCQRSQCNQIVSVTLYHRNALTLMVSQASCLLFLGLIGFTTTDPLKLNENALHQESYVDQCTPVPTWSIHGERVVNLVGENITVIALLNSSRLYGRQQTGMLNVLRNRLYQAGFSAIDFMIVDSMLPVEKSQLLRIELPNIPVYKQQPRQPVQDVVGSGNDQVLVLDRCGRIAYQVITPFSKLTHPYVKAAILSTYTDNPCGKCNQTGKATYFDYEEENDSILIYASDAQDIADEKFPTNAIKETHKIHNTSKMVHTLRKNAFQTQNRSVQSLALNFSTVESEGRSNPSSPESLQGSQANATAESMKTLNCRSEMLTLSTKQVQRRKAFGRMPLPEAQHTLNETVERNFDLQVGYQDESSKNWDWSQSRNQSVVNTRASDEQTAQSVEVVRQVSRSPKKNMLRSKKEEALKHVPMYAIDSQANRNNNQMLQDHNAILVNSLSPESSGDSDSRERSENSLEELMNQTQKLFDWYQKQIENGTSSEEEYERSDILKFKIIEHYSKLLPWLHYKLTPQVKN